MAYPNSFEPEHFFPPAAGNDNAYLTLAYATGAAPPPGSSVSHSIGDFDPVFLGDSNFFNESPDHHLHHPTGHGPGPMPPHPPSSHSYSHPPGSSSATHHPYQPQRGEYRVAALGPAHFLPPTGGHMAPPAHHHPRHPGFPAEPSSQSQQLQAPGQAQPHPGRGTFDPQPIASSGSGLLTDQAHADTVSSGLASSSSCSSSSSSPSGPAVGGGGPGPGAGPMRDGYSISTEGHPPHAGFHNAAASGGPGSADAYYGPVPGHLAGRPGVGGPGPDPSAHPGTYGHSAEGRHYSYGARGPVYDGGPRHPGDGGGAPGPGSGPGDFHPGGPGPGASASVGHSHGHSHGHGPVGAPGQGPAGPPPPGAWSSPPTYHSSPGGHAEQPPAGQRYFPPGGRPLGPPPGQGGPGQQHQQYQQQHQQHQQHQQQYQQQQQQHQPPPHHQQQQQHQHQHQQPHYHHPHHHPHLAATSSSSSSSSSSSASSPDFDPAAVAATATGVAGGFPATYSDSGAFLAKHGAAAMPAVAVKPDPAVAGDESSIQALSRRLDQSCVSHAAPAVPDSGKPVAAATEPTLPPRKRHAAAGGDPSEVTAVPVTAASASAAAAGPVRARAAAAAAEEPDQPPEAESQSSDDSSSDEGEDDPASGLRAVSRHKRHSSRNSGGSPSPDLDDLAGGASIGSRKLASIRREAAAAEAAAALSAGQALDADAIELLKQHNHNVSERRRQQSINSAINQLYGLLPDAQSDLLEITGLEAGLRGDRKPSKAAILSRSVTFVDTLTSSCRSLHRSNLELRLKVRQLQDRIAQLERAAASGPGASDGGPASEGGPGPADGPSPSPGAGGSSGHTTPGSSGGSSARGPTPSGGQPLPPPGHAYSQPGHSGAYSQMSRSVPPAGAPGSGSLGGGGHAHGMHGPAGGLPGPVPAPDLGGSVMVNSPPDGSAGPFSSPGDEAPPASAGSFSSAPGAASSSASFGSGGVPSAPPSGSSNGLNTPLSEADQAAAAAAAGAGGNPPGAASAAAAAAAHPYHHHHHHSSHAPVGRQQQQQQAYPSRHPAGGLSGPFAGHYPGGPPAGGFAGDAPGPGASPVRSDPSGPPPSGLSPQDRHFFRHEPPSQQPPPHWQQQQQQQQQFMRRGPPGGASSSFVTPAGLAGDDEASRRYAHRPDGAPLPPHLIAPPATSGGYLPGGGPLAPFPSDYHQPGYQQQQQQQQQQTPYYDYHRHHQYPLAGGDGYGVDSLADGRYYGPPSHGYRMSVPDGMSPGPPGGPPPRGWYLPAAPASDDGLSTSGGGYPRGEGARLPPAGLAAGGPYYPGVGGGESPRRQAPPAYHSRGSAPGPLPPHGSLYHSGGQYGGSPAAAAHQAPFAPGPGGEFYYPAGPGQDGPVDGFYPSHYSPSYREGGRAATQPKPWGPAPPPGAPRHFLQPQPHHLRSGAGGSAPRPGQGTMPGDRAPAVAEAAPVLALPAPAQAPATADLAGAPGVLAGDGPLADGPVAGGEGAAPDAGGPVPAVAGEHLPDGGAGLPLAEINPRKRRSPSFFAIDGALSVCVLVSVVLLLMPLPNYTPPEAGDMASAMAAATLEGSLPSIISTEVFASTRAKILSAFVSFAYGPLCSVLYVTLGFFRWFGLMTLVKVLVLVKTLSLSPQMASNTRKARLIREHADRLAFAGHIAEARKLYLQAGRLIWGRSLELAAATEDSSLEDMSTERQDASQGRSFAGHFELGLMRPFNVRRTCLLRCRLPGTRAEDDPQPPVAEAGTEAQALMQGPAAGAEIEPDTGTGAEDGEVPDVAPATTTAVRPAAEGMASQAALSSAVAAPDHGGVVSRRGRGRRDLSIMNASYLTKFAMSSALEHGGPTLAMERSMSASSSTSSLGSSASSPMTASPTPAPVSSEPLAGPSSDLLQLLKDAEVDMDQALPKPAPLPMWYIQFYTTLYCSYLMIAMVLDRITGSMFSVIDRRVLSMPGLDESSDELINILFRLYQSQHCHTWTSCMKHSIFGIIVIQLEETKHPNSPLVSELMAYQSVGFRRSPYTRLETMYEARARSLAARYGIEQMRRVDAILRLQPPFPPAVPFFVPLLLGLPVMIGYVSNFVFRFMDTRTPRSSSLSLSMES